MVGEGAVLGREGGGGKGGANKKKKKHRESRQRYLTEGVRLEGGKTPEEKTLPDGK